MSPLPAPDPMSSVYKADSISYRTYMRWRTCARGHPGPFTVVPRITNGLSEYPYIIADADGVCCTFCDLLPGMEICDDWNVNGPFYSMIADTAAVAELPDG